MIFFQNDIYDWLRLLNLEQYYSTLANQGYDNIDYVVDITWEDLEEIGIQRLGRCFTLEINSILDSSFQK